MQHILLKLELLGNFVVHRKDALWYQMPIAKEKISLIYW